MNIVQSENLIQEREDGIYFRDGAVEFYLGSKKAPENVNKEGVHNCLYYLINVRLRLVNEYGNKKLPTNTQNRLRSIENAVNTIAETYMPFPRNDGQKRRN